MRRYSTGKGRATTRRGQRIQRYSRANRVGRVSNRWKSKWTYAQRKRFVQGLKTHMKYKYGGPKFRKFNAYYRKRRLRY